MQRRGSVDRATGTRRFRVMNEELPIAGRPSLHQNERTKRRPAPSLPPPPSPDPIIRIDLPLAEALPAKTIHDAWLETRNELSPRRMKPELDLHEQVPTVLARDCGSVRQGIPGDPPSHIAPDRRHSDPGGVIARPRCSRT